MVARAAHIIIIITVYLMTPNKEQHHTGAGAAQPGGLAPEGGRGSEACAGLLQGRQAACLLPTGLQAVREEKTPRKNVLASAQRQ